MSKRKQYPESLKNFTARMMKQLTGAYLNFRPSENPEQAEAYVGGIARMVDEFGQGRTSAAILKAIDLIPDFAPTLGKIREFMPAREGELKTCTLCHPSGFVMVYTGKTDGGNDVDPDLGAAKRCDHLAGKSPVVDIPPEKGYGTNDVKILMKLHAKARALSGGIPLSKREQEELLDELDKVTGRG
jgi:hypothetical protein